MTAGSLGFVLGVLASCGRADSSCPSATPGEEAIEAPDIAVAQLVEDPHSYDGQTVRVTGEIERVLDTRTFVLRGDGLLWAPTVRVELAVSTNLLSAVHEHVRVVGTFRDGHDRLLVARSFERCR